MTLLILGSDIESLRLLTMRYLDSGIRGEGELALVGVLVLCQRLLLLVLGLSLSLLILLSWQLDCALRIGLSLVSGRLLSCSSLLEAFVGGLEERHMVIERFHVEGTIDVQVAVVRDGIT